MKSTRTSGESKTLRELQKIFAAPDVVAKRYSRRASILFVSAIAVAAAAGIANATMQLEDVSAVMLVASGALVGFSVSFRAAARNAPLLAKYCKLDTESVAQRLNESSK